MDGKLGMEGQGRRREGASLLLDHPPKHKILHKSLCCAVMSVCHYVFRFDNLV